MSNTSLEMQISELKKERDHFMNIAYNAITLGQLHEQYSENDLISELGCTKAEYEEIMN